MYIVFQKTVTPGYLTKAIRSTCVSLGKKPTELKLKQTTEFTSMIEQIFQFFKEKKTNPLDLITSLEEKKKRMAKQTGSVQIPVVRYFVRATDGTKIDLENRERVLQFSKHGDTDEMARALANVEIQKRKKKNKEEEVPDMAAGGEMSEEEETGGIDFDGLKYGGTARVWAVPTRYVCEFEVINGDVKTDIPSANYDLVLMDPPYGYGYFSGDTVWRMDEVHFSLCRLDIAALS